MKIYLPSSSFFHEVCVIGNGYDNIAMLKYILRAMFVTVLDTTITNIKRGFILLATDFLNNTVNLFQTIYNV